MLNKDRHNKNLGDKGEGLVLNFYKNNGWEIYVQNFTARGSELDLVFTKSEEKEGNGKVKWLFVEVKSAVMNVNSANQIRPEDNFTKNKIKHFKRGIEYFMLKNGINQFTDNIEIQIDLACVYFFEKETRLKIYKNIIFE